MGEPVIKPNVTCPYCQAQWFEQSEELLDLRSALSAARASLASAERERDEWKEKCREANRQRSRVWGRAERAEESASRLAAIEAALRTEQAQHALTKRGHNNAVAWVASLLEDAVRADTAESALSAAREEATAAKEDAQNWRDFCLRHPEIPPPAVANEIATLRADLSAAREEARRLTEERDAARSFSAALEIRIESWRALLAASESSARRLREALRVYFPAGSWCAKCGQSIDAPSAKPCSDKERGCDAARAALGSSPVTAPSSREGGGEG